MTPDHLDALPDEELNAVFAVEVARTHVQHAPGSTGAPLMEGQRDYYRKKDGAYFGVAQDGRCTIGSGHWPNYCGAADAVLPELERHPNSAAYRCYLNPPGHAEQPMGWCVILEPEEEGTTTVIQGRAASFARAAVLALIRNARAGAKSA